MFFFDERRTTNDFRWISLPSSKRFWARISRETFSISSLTPPPRAQRINLNGTEKKEKGKFRRKRFSFSMFYESFSSDRSFLPLVFVQKHRSNVEQFRYNRHLTDNKSKFSVFSSARLTKWSLAIVRSLSLDLELATKSFQFFSFQSVSSIVVLPEEELEQYRWSFEIFLIERKTTFFSNLLLTLNLFIVSIFTRSRWSLTHINFRLFIVFCIENRWNCFRNDVALRFVKSLKTNSIKKTFFSSLKRTWKYFSSRKVSFRFVNWKISSSIDGLRRCSNNGHVLIEANALKRRKVAVKDAIA